MRGHVTKKGNKWYAVIFMGFGDDGKRKYKWHSGFDTKKAAEKFLTEKVHEVNTGTYTEPSKKTVADYMQEWLAFKETQVRPNTFINYVSKVDNHIIPKLGRMQLANLKPQNLQELYTYLINDAELSKRSVVHIHRILHDALSRAVKWNLIPRNPAEAVDPPKASQAKIEVWDREQALKFLNEAQKNRYFIAFILAITTGMRLGEIMGLKWSDIDFDNEQLFVRRTLSFVTGSAQEHEPKTERSRRIVALPPQTIEALRIHREVQNRERSKFVDKYHDDDFIVTRDIGIVPNPRAIRDAYLGICKRAGIPHIRFHDLRHTHATMLLEQGVHPKIVSERLGHSTIGITLDIYTHVLPSLQKKTAKDFGNALFGDDPKNGD